MALITTAREPRSILFATDFSQPSEKALRHSLALARFYKSDFCLAHVMSSLGFTMAGPDAITRGEEAISRDFADLEASLLRTGALTGIQHKFIVRQGELWPELREIIREENSDLLVVGTHGRHGIAKLFFGSVAEQIFRQANCPVLTFGPNTASRPWFETSTTQRTFLFATDFGLASLRGLPQAVAAANKFGARLVLLSIVPRASRNHQRVNNHRADARLKTLQRLAELADSAEIHPRPELYAELESPGRVSEKILETADELRADLIVMGLHDAPHTGIISHLDLADTYDVVCHAGSPVLTVNSAFGA